MRKPVRQWQPSGTKRQSKSTLVMESATLPLAQFPEAYCQRGLACYETGELNRALTDFMRAIELKPEYAVAYNNRGMVYEKMGEHDKALISSRQGSWVTRRRSDKHCPPDQLTPPAPPRTIRATSGRAIRGAGERVRRYELDDKIGGDGGGGVAGGSGAGRETASGRRVQGACAEREAGHRLSNRITVIEEIQ